MPSPGRDAVHMAVVAAAVTGAEETLSSICISKYRFDLEMLAAVSEPLSRILGWNPEPAEMPCV